MTHLPTESADRAWAFLETCARPLERVLARHVVRGGPAQDVWRALEAYQTQDGGFGNGIEPDLRTPASQGISTSVAFSYLRQSGAPKDLPMVRRAIDHLLSTLDRNGLFWTAIDGRVDLAPHAPWWDAGDLDRFHGFAFNPTGDLVAACFEYADLVPGDLLDALTETTLERLHAFAPLTEIYDLYPCVRLNAAANLPAELGKMLSQRIEEDIAQLDLDDPHADLFALCPTPESPGHSRLASRFPALTKTLAETQAPDGSWRPFWDWSFVDEAAWAAADADWAAVLTANRLIGLHRHGRL